MYIFNSMTEQNANKNLFVQEKSDNGKQENSEIDFVQAINTLNPNTQRYIDNKPQKKQTWYFACMHLTTI